MSLPIDELLREARAAGIRPSLGPDRRLRLRMPVSRIGDLARELRRREREVLAALAAEAAQAAGRDTQ
jgi:hypothetical protein